MYHSIPSEANTFLRQIFSFSKKKKAVLYLVGGYLRDLLLKREKLNPDLDFCIKRGSIAFGRALAKEIWAGFVVLDKENGSCRVVKKLKNKIYTFDFTDFRGESLKDDLFHRDFTINTLAVELESALTQKPIEKTLIDFFGAQKDIARKVIRTASPGAFDEDPLRILRAFSLSATFGFSIEKETLRLLKLKRQGLESVSRERIRDELFKIFDSARAFDTCARMDSLKILKIVIPELECMRKVSQGPYHHLDVFVHSLEALHQLEMLFIEKRKNTDIQHYTHAVLSGGRTRGALLKFACLVHDIGKPRARRWEKGKLKFYGHELIGARISEVIARGLKLSNDEVDATKKIVFCHLRPGYLGDSPKPTPRAVFRYFRDTGEDAPGILLLSIADQRATRGPLTTKESCIQHEKVCLSLIREYFRRQKEKIIPRLVNGDDLIRVFTLSPSPLIGRLLADLEELQAIGKIKSKKEALRHAAQLIPLQKSLGL